MPDVPGPNNERLHQLIGDMANRIARLEQQQQQVVTDSQGNPIVVLGPYYGQSNAGVPLQGLAVQKAGTDPTNGTGVVLWSGTYPFNDGTGQSQETTVLYRDDGTPALSVYDGNPTPGHTHLQYLALYDRGGNMIFNDDTGQGVGISHPALPITLPQNANTSTWPQTSSGSLTPIAYSFFQQLQAKINWSIWCYCSATSGTVTLVVNGTTVGTQTLTNGFFTWNGSTLVSPGWSFEAQQQLTINAQVTGGAGIVAAQPLNFWGSGS